jgi:hypothetical protein
MLLICFLNDFIIIIFVTAIRKAILHDCRESQARIPQSGFQARSQNWEKRLLVPYDVAIWRIPVACLIRKATCTRRSARARIAPVHSREYAIFFSFDCNSDRERPSLLRYTYVGFLVYCISITLLNTPLLF